MSPEELKEIAGMLASCAGVTIFVLSFIAGCLLESKLNWFKW